MTKGNVNRKKISAARKSRKVRINKSTTLKQQNDVLKPVTNRSKMSGKLRKRLEKSARRALKENETKTSSEAAVNAAVAAAIDDIVMQ